MTTITGSGFVLGAGVYTASGNLDQSLTFTSLTLNGIGSKGI